ncbi:hypothetical protein ABPG74_000414 [Tetrahymena malaccensis]
MTRSIQKSPKILVEFFFDNLKVSSEQLDQAYIPLFQELVQQCNNNELKLHNFNEDSILFKANTCFLMKHDPKIDHRNIPKNLKGIRKNKKQNCLNKTQRLNYIDGIYNNLSFRVVKLQNLSYQKTDEDQLFQNLQNLKGYVLVHTYNSDEQNNQNQNELSLMNQQPNRQDHFADRTPDSLIQKQREAISKSSLNCSIGRQSIQLTKNNSYFEEEEEEQDQQETQNLRQEIQIEQQYVKEESQSQQVDEDESDQKLLNVQQLNGFNGQQPNRQNHFTQSIKDSSSDNDYRNKQEPNSSQIVGRANTQIKQEQEEQYTKQEFQGIQEEEIQDIQQLEQQQLLQQQNLKEEYEQQHNLGQIRGEFHDQTNCQQQIKDLLKQIQYLQTVISIQEKQIELDQLKIQFLQSKQ